MAVDPSIITAGMRQPEQVDPMGVLGKVLTLRNAQQDNQLGAIKLQQAQQGQADQQSLDKAYANGGLDRNAILVALPGHLRPTVMKQFAEADEKAATVQKTQMEVSKATNDYFGHLAAGIRDHGYDPTAAQIAIAHAKETYANNPQMLQQIGQIEQQVSDPAQIKPLADHLISISDEQQKADAAAITAKSRAQAADTSAKRLTAEMPKITAETLRAQNQAAGTEPITPYQKAELARQGAANAETARHNKVSEGALTDDALNMAADQFAATGVMSSAGRSAAQRALILNRAAQRQPAVDLASNAAAYKANQSSLQNVTKTLDTLTAFESTAGKNLDQFETAFKKLEDTGSPLLNVPLRALANRVGGNPDVAAANAAGTVALREIARVTNDPKLSGVLSDSARQEVASLVPEGATLKQLAAVTKVLKADMANVHSSLSDQKDAISSRISGKKTDAAPPKFSVGDVVTVGGKQIKITALHPDGTFDGDPVKK